MPANNPMHRCGCLFAGMARAYKKAFSISAGASHACETYPSAGVTPLRESAPPPTAFNIP